MALKSFGLGYRVGNRQLNIRTHLAFLSACEFGLFGLPEWLESLLLGIGLDALSFM